MSIEKYYSRFIFIFLKLVRIFQLMSIILSLFSYYYYLFEKTYQKLNLFRD